MELAGDEQKIRALYSELAVQDGHNAPRFQKLWNRAAVTPRQAPRKALVAISLVGLVSLVSVTLLVLRKPTGSVQSVVAPTKRTTVTESKLIKPAETLIATVRPSHIVSKHSGRRRPPATKDIVVQNAFDLSRWQSPTALLMKSPARLLLTERPQLTQPAKDLHSFLSDTMKEQNQ